MSERKAPPGYDEAIRALRERLDAPVDDAMLADVHRKVRVAIAGRATTRRPLLLVAMVVAAVVLLAVGSVLLRRSVARPRGVQVVVAGKASPLAADGRLNVRDGEHVVLTLDDTARLEVRGPARVATGGDGRIILESGRAEVSVAKQPVGKHVAFGFGELTATVHGTRFIMLADDGRGMSVEVREGVVEVTPPEGPSVMLHIGEQWHRAEAPPPASAPTPEPAPVPEAPPVISNKVLDKPQAKKSKLDLRAAAEKAMARRDCDETRVLVGRYIAELDDTAEAARASMLVAECWLRAGNKLEALPVLDRIAKDYAGAPGAQSALFEAATTRADLKQTIEAIAGFEDYLQRYPKGTFAESAAFRRCELLAGQASHKTASSCLGDFVERFPKGRRAGDALLLAGSLDCADERYSDATEAFWAYTKHMAPERDDVANLESLVRCLERGKVADAPRAREALKKRRP